MQTLPVFSAASAEILTGIMICVTLLAQTFLGDKVKQIAYYLVQISLVAAFILLARELYDPAIITFSGMFDDDAFSRLLKLSICAVSFFVFLYSREYITEKNMPSGEYYILGLSSILGMLVLVSSYNFLTLFMGLELFSLPVYAMVALQRKSVINTEAAMKYFIVGAIGSGMLLYGISMFYGATQSLNFADVAKVVADSSAPQSMLLVFALVFVVSGVAFKLGAVPFHMWVPDVYDGAPTAVTLFISSAPKIAAMAMALRIFVDALPGLVLQWQPILIVLAIFSMALGNIVAIAQSNIKRMLAYSSIAHIGYALLGVIAATDEGYSTAIFYIISYAIMTSGAFGLLTVMSRNGVEIENIADLQGLSDRNPWLAFMMLLVIFSMAGIPPFVGFMAKVAVLEALISVHLVWLAALALLFAIIGVYYYIRVIKVMYFDSSKAKQQAVNLPLDKNIAISVNGLAVLVLGIFPGSLFGLCLSVVHTGF